MAEYINIPGDLRVHKLLHSCVEKDILPQTGISANKFWSSFSSVVRDFSNRNDALLRKRDAIQASIDAFLLERKQKGLPWDEGAYTSFLSQIGYLAPQGPDFKVDTQNVDDEIATKPGPQLVVPIDNARYVLNAANSRWGSLMDAFYGTDAGPPETDGCEKGKTYNPKRGEKVFEYAHDFLDTYFPLARGAKFGDVSEFQLADGGRRLVCKLKKGGAPVGLDTESKFVGYTTSPSGGSTTATTALSSVLLRNNHLHVIIEIDRTSEIGKTHAAGVKDIILESAVTAIADCEDSVAAVDAEDKARVYRNWTGLMKGTLSEKMEKGGKTVTRALHSDKEFTSSSNPNSKVTLPGRALLLVRNVGMHLYTDSVLLPESEGGREVPEGIVDALITTLAAMHDLKPQQSQKSANMLNSRKGSMYLVKPKLHGPEEVQFTVDLVARVEKELGLPENTVKLGIMDEERRTTVNLAECIRVAKHRCIFINTGFLDRTGDEIHTSFYAGPVLPKGEIKGAKWRLAYEDWNVDVGIQCGLVGVAQIGKGMWSSPDAMGSMLKTKGEHPKAGATTAWVPSPTAATLHAIHYHETDVLAVQKRLKEAGPRAKLSDILVPPLLEHRSKKLTKEEITFELENNAQGILGYVVRWIEMGVGCSKVPDLHDVGLMEDRATLRISSQLIANWLYHGIATRDQVRHVFEKMAQVVDRQNKGSAGYRPMSPEYSNNGFECALEMCFKGAEIPNGLTEGTLTQYRRAEKEQFRKSKM